MKYTTKYLLKQFEDAVRKDEMRGASDPEIRDDLHNRYLGFKKLIKKCLKKKKIKV